MKKVLILGGNGFIGSAIRNEFSRRGLETIVGTRAKNRLLKPGERRVCFHTASDADWARVIRGCDIVVNAVGILRERWGETYEQVHSSAPKRLAEACKDLGCKFLHVSALGLENPVQSQFLLSKRRGEQAIMATDAKWCIVRAPLLEGQHGYGARWFRRVASWPVHMTPSSARGLIAPMHVEKFAKVLVDLALSERSKVIYEASGEECLSFRTYLTRLGRQPWFHLAVPSLIVRMFCHLFDLLHLTPLSYGHYELMQRDNLPKHMSLNSDAEVTSKTVLPI